MTNAVATGSYFGNNMNNVREGAYVDTGRGRKEELGEGGHGGEIFICYSHTTHSMENSLFVTPHDRRAERGRGSRERDTQADKRPCLVHALRSCRVLHCGGSLFVCSSRVERELGRDSAGM